MAIRTKLKRRQRVLGVLLALLTCFMALNSLTVNAQTYRAYAKKNTGGTYFQRHPYQKTGLIGAGAGAVAGGVLFGDKNRGRNIMRGAVVGGAAGLGYQYLKKRGTIK